MQRLNDPSLRVTFIILNQDYLQFEKDDQKNFKKLVEYFNKDRGVKEKQLEFLLIRD